MKYTTEEWTDIIISAITVIFMIVFMVYMYTYYKPGEQEWQQQLPPSEKDPAQEKRSPPV